MKQPAEIRKLVAAGVARMFARLRSDLSCYHADELEALEKIRRPETEEAIVNRLMTEFGGS